MSILESIRVAFTSLRSNLLRAILTMLGIIIGVGAVITLLALGGAIQTLVTRELQGLGSNLVFVFAGTNDPEQNRRVPPKLNNDDIAALADPLNVPSAVEVASQMTRGGLILYRAQCKGR
jgi:putative ABC transport system permease protein